MTIKRIEPHGDWASDITVETLTQALREPSSARACPKTGRAYFRETAAGRSTIIQVNKDNSVKDVLPKPYSVGNTVYEYSVQPYNILRDGRIIFSTLKGTFVLDPDAGQVTPLIQNPVLRHGAYNADPNSDWVIAIEEDHTIDEPDHIKNYLVAINTETAEIKRIVSGADFYYNPSFSADGSRVAWMQWDRPQMMFEHSEIYHAAWNKDASVTDIKFVTGKNEESAAEPRWASDGTLFFAQEVNGYRQLFRIPAGSDKAEHIALKGLEKADLGEVMLMEGSATYEILSDRHVIAKAHMLAVSKLVVIDLQTSQWRQVGQEFDLSHVYSSAIARLDESTAIVIGSTPTTSRSVYKIDITDSTRSTMLRSASDNPLAEKWISTGKPICCKSKSLPSRDIHGFLFMPKNPNFAAPDGELPPLIIDAHGGPTGIHGNGLLATTQYFTSRGYAMLLLNYSGSIGFGGEYRRRLLGNWGPLDASDAVEFAELLVDAGKIRKGSVGITGHSAGGFNTLQCITRHPKAFAGAVCAAGVSELVTFESQTHKLEADYTRHLIIAKGTSEKDIPELFRSRSAQYFADEIVAPLLLIHGIEDTVVPISQASGIYETLKAKGNDVELIALEGEDHMLSAPTTRKAWIEAAERWWRKTLLKQ